MLMSGRPLAAERKGHETLGSDTKVTKLPRRREKPSLLVPGRTQKSKKVNYMRIWKLFRRKTEKAPKWRALPRWRTRLARARADAKKVETGGKLDKWT